MNSTNSQVKSNKLWQLSYHCKKDTTMFHSLSYDATFDSGSPYQQFMVFGKCQRTGKYPQRTNDLSASRFFDQFFGFFEIVGPSQEPVLGFVVFQRNGRSVMGPYPFCCPLSASPFFAKESNCTTTLV